MALQLEKAAPNSTLESTEGTVSFYERLDCWAVLFSQPADCTRVLGAFAKRGAKLAGGSVASWIHVAAGRGLTRPSKERLLHGWQQSFTG